MVCNYKSATVWRDICKGWTNFPTSRIHAVLSFSLSDLSQTTKDNTHIWKSNEHPQKYCILAQSSRHSFSVWEFSLWKIDPVWWCWYLFQNFLHFFPTTLTGTFPVYFSVPSHVSFFLILFVFSLFCQSFSSISAISLSHHLLKSPLVTSVLIPFNNFNYLFSSLL